ncbi:hypothetical protein G7Y89_g365 [Cudoniella acicularis]|uniref:Uncharacterized protein n=1 Tax=Cudoniella acicularis TaxID=354080 RepID=A0A8H4WAG6_9HELO|nr:hypothetical protein G7Y89_g365 [Cudoniella acicularis]
MPGRSAVAVAVAVADGVGVGVDILSGSKQRRAVTWVVNLKRGAEHKTSAKAARAQSQEEQKAMQDKHHGDKASMGQHSALTAASKGFEKNGTVRDTGRFCRLQIADSRCHGAHSGECPKAIAAQPASRSICLVNRCADVHGLHRGVQKQRVTRLHLHASWKEALADLLEHF